MPVVDDTPAEVVSDRVLTVPNALSLLRLLLLPIVYLDLTSGREGRALVVLAVGATTDWLDGWIARRFNQVSRVGKLFDPVSDRLLVAVVGIAMIVADLLPLWAVLVLVVRDVVLVVGAAVLLARGASPPAVTFIGKTATFGLMFALPLFIGASVVEQPWLRTVAWLLYGVSTLLYYVAGVQYLRDGTVQLRALRDAGETVY